VQRAVLLQIARKAMIEHGLEPDFPPAALAEADSLVEPKAAPGKDVGDLRAEPWCSIDNDDSRDLDQLTLARARERGVTEILVAVADVSAAVPRSSAVDDHAIVNTTSVYTPPRNFPMLPERLSTDLTSLNPDEDRLAIVVSMTVDEAGAVSGSNVSRAWVHNQAKLAYRGVSGWLEGTSDLPPAARDVTGLAENLRLQDGVAQRLRARRHEHGALELETIEVRATFDGDSVTGLAAERRLRAKELIEDFMIAANGAIAGFLEGRRFPVLRRVVRSPERWPRIVELARALGTVLSGAPDAKALHDFLLARRAADPERFPDLSLSVIKLLGKGEYAVGAPGEAVTGHFGLAVREYTHSTAPNRRYPDLVTQRLLKAALEGREAPYTVAQLTELARHCTQQEDAAQKVERQLRKSAAACMLADRVGAEFDGLVTGAGPKGTWVRVFEPPVEGRVEGGQQGLDVGDRVHVKLLHTDVERGFIDFARAR
jgi:exoribonuclease-2